ncbi:unnamed protein product [Closterium sp. NIES-53]
MLGEGEQMSFMVVYVDDILIFSPSSDLVKEVMLKLQDKFKCKALGDVNFYLGLHIERDVEKRCMRVHQRKYLEALAANFGQSEGHVATPFPSGFKCVKGPEKESVGEEERRHFHSLVGSLMYAAVNTRPDVAFATGQLARVVQCPNKEQVAAGMRVAKYLGQTATVGLQYSAAAQRRQKGADGVEPGSLFLTAFSDASYASEPEDMTSVGGFICCVGGGPTAWESKKQVDQALSSVESEYMALFRASVVSLRLVLSHLLALLVAFLVRVLLLSPACTLWQSDSASPPSVGGEFALGTDVLDDRQEDFECLAAAVPCFASMPLSPERDPDAPDIPTSHSYAEAITGPYSSQRQAAMDAKMASGKSTGTYVDKVPPLGANLVDGMWIFRVKRPPGSPPAFMARYVARGFSQRQGVDYFQAFSPAPNMTALWVLLHVASQRDYKLHSLDFSTTFLQGSLHKEIWLRRPPSFTGLFPAGTQWSLRWPVYGLHHAPREWHDTLRTTLAALGFAPSTADPLLFLRIVTSLPPFYVLVYKRHTCTDHLGQSTAHHHPDSVTNEPSGPYPELVGCLMYLMTCTRPDIAYPLSLLARYVAPGRHRKVQWDAVKRVLRYLCTQRESGHKVKVIRTDNGGEFFGADFEAVLKKKGIQHQLTVPYNPQQNGVAERFNRTLQEGARTLLGVLVTVGDKQWVPYTKWYGSAPAVNMLRAYECMVVFHVPKEKRGKLEASGRWGVHLGLAKDHKGWLIWDLTSQQLTVSRDVKFLESLYYKEWKQQQQKLPTTPLIIEADEVQRPSRQVQVTILDEISGVTEDGGEPEVEEQQQ